MARLLILFAHPLLEKSRVHHQLLEQAKNIPDVTINDLYQNYPDFDIDIEKEKNLLLQHDIIIWQHPFYWYSAPALLKQWQDLVLEHGWAYGKKGTALQGKKAFNVMTSGGASEAYAEGGYNRYPIHDYLKPFEQTALLCRMTYWPPFWVNGVHRMDQHEIREYASRYRNLLFALSRELITEEAILKTTELNHLFLNPSMQSDHGTT
ncbi:MAG TPA: NAD(P)H-dependent oxidoreductase [Flavisolibacter sp.]|jgi:glutathione-regulated potassium-efflux system ancillary protein KefG|nr:NAD(P)H-dependent oxidoreductase [Flavisolibacter sp.]